MSSTEAKDKADTSSDPSYALVKDLLLKLKRRQLSTTQVATETLEALRKVIVGTKGTTPKILIEKVRSVGRQLIAAQPSELVVGNIVRRVLFIIREEHATIAAGHTEGRDGEGEERTGTFQMKNPSLGGVLEGEISIHHSLAEAVPSNFKQVVSSNIKELIHEISTIKEQVADQAMEHVHANEVILTFGHSNTTFHFLREVAKRDRKFEVVIAEGAPALQGHTMAQELAKAGISTTVISDAAIFGMMSRVNKVIVGCHAVLANGGILAPTGMHMVATAAKHHNVPFVVCTGMYKLAPVFPHDQYSFNELRCPAEVAGPSVPHNAAVLNPSSDYVPPDMVSIFITNAGGHNPSYIYRLMADNYCMEDRASL